MKRFFGAGGPKQPAPSLSDTAASLDARGQSLDEKIRAIDKQLAECRAQLQRNKNNTLVKQRALRLLKQKRMYETQRGQMMNQAFSVEQANFGVQSMQDTVTTVAAMKQANKTMKQQFKKIDIDDVENTMDDMEDLLEQNNEIQESLGRTYGVDVDEDELEAELEMLGDELDFGETEEPEWATSLPTADPSGPTPASAVAEPLTN